jgi:hypothetical protein
MACKLFSGSYKVIRCSEDFKNFKNIDDHGIGEAGYLKV